MVDKLSAAMVELARSSSSTLLSSRDLQLDVVSCEGLILPRGASVIFSEDSVAAWATLALHSDPPEDLRKIVRGCGESGCVP